MRAIIASCALLVMSFGVIVADDFVGLVTKVEIKDGKATITGKKGKKDEAKEFTLTVPAGIKVSKGSKKDGKIEAGDPIEDGLKNDIFKNASTEKPVFASFSTDKDEKVTSIVVLQKKKKKSE